MMTLKVHAMQISKVWETLKYHNIQINAGDITNELMIMQPHGHRHLK